MSWRRPVRAVEGASPTTTGRPGPKAGGFERMEREPGTVTDRSLSAWFFLWLGGLNVISTGRATLWNPGRATLQWSSLQPFPPNIGPWVTRRLDPSGLASPLTPRGFAEINAFETRRDP
jgi:hypothetical protein